MRRGSERRHGGGTTSRLSVRIGTPVTEVRQRWSGGVQRRFSDGPAEVQRRRRRSNGGLVEAAALVATAEAEATMTKRKNTLSSRYHVENKENRD